MSQTQTTVSRQTSGWLIAFAMLFPTIMAWAYFLRLGGSGQPNLTQQATYALGKTIQFLLPIFFLAFIARRWPIWKGDHWRGLLWGLGFGLLVSGAMLAAYHGGLRSSKLLAEAPARIRAKMEEFGVASPVGFLGLSLFLSIAHSFLEEYYWRWFVFGQLRNLVPVSLAILLSSLGFMSHHVLVLWAYFPDKILTAVVPASVAIAVGGAVWAWLYHRAGSLLAPWLSHALVDAALVLIGWDMLQRAL
jgi:membrane protease YdiL (CAAX protease family)